MYIECIVSKCCWVLFVEQQINLVNKKFLNWKDSPWKALISFFVFLSKMFKWPALIAS